MDVGCTLDLGKLGYITDFRLWAVAYLKFWQAGQGLS